MELSKPKAKVIKLGNTAGTPPAAQVQSGPTGYFDQIAGYAARIRQTRDASEIIRILDEALQETRNLHHVDELAVARRQVADAERAIARLKDEIQELSGMLREDPLTMALNRRGFDEVYSRESARADRRHQPMCLVLLDLDDFKRLNDTHGHQAGDAALVSLTRLARATLRPSDSIARFGGEEFVLLLPDTETESALRATHRLATRLAERPLSHAGRDLSISFSAGISLRQYGEGLDGVLRRADEALYQAKHTGKNRVEVAAG